MLLACWHRTQGLLFCYSTQGMNDKPNYDIQPTATLNVVLGNCFGKDSIVTWLFYLIRAPWALWSFTAASSLLFWFLHILTQFWLSLSSLMRPPHATCTDTIWRTSEGKGKILAAKESDIVSEMEETKAELKGGEICGTVLLPLLCSL